MVAILLKNGEKNSGQELIINSQFESLNLRLLEKVLEGFKNLDSTTLQRGLDHRNSRVRLEALKVLLDRCDLDQQELEPFLQDGDASIRNEAVMALTRLGRSFGIDEVRKILVLPEREPQLSFMGVTMPQVPDVEGEKLFASYQLKELEDKSDIELTKKVESSLLYDDDPYFVRAEKYFSQHMTQLRRDVDDNFGDYFDERFRRIIDLIPGFGRDFGENPRNVEDIVRKRLTRRGLDILCKVGMAEDLQRIRDSIQSDYTPSSVVEVEYLKRYGEWQDIPLVVEAYGAMATRAQVDETHDDLCDRVSLAILRMGRNKSVSKLFSIEMPSPIVRRTIQLCPPSRFAKISYGVLVAFLDHEEADVRRAAAIKSVQSLPAERTASILREYISGDTAVYYNVIHWLDLGVSMPPEDVVKVLSVVTR